MVNRPTHRLELAWGNPDGMRPGADRRLMPVQRESLDQAWRCFLPHQGFRHMYAEERRGLQEIPLPFSGFYRKTERIVSSSRPQTRGTSGDGRFQTRREAERPTCATWCRLAWPARSAASALGSGFRASGKWGDPVSTSDGADQRRFCQGADKALARRRRATASCFHPCPLPCRMLERDIRETRLSRA